MSRLAAELPRRAAACVIDAAIPVAVAGIATAMVGLISGRVAGPVVSAAVLTVAMLVFLVITSAMQGRSASVGMQLLGLRLQGEGDRRPVGFARALLRNVVWLALCAVVVGFFTPLFDRSGARQGWHDRAVNAIVTRRGERARVVPEIPSGDVHAAEWLAAMSSTGDTGPITDVPVVRTGDPARTARPGQLIAEVPGITQDRIELEHLQAAHRAGRPLGPVQAAALERARRTTSAAGVVTIDVANTGEPTAEQPTVREGADMPADESSTTSDPHGPGTVAVPTQRARDMNGVRACATLVWDDGTQFRVYTRTVFGRNPVPEGGAQIATVLDNSLSLSKTHFEVIRTPEDAAEIIDLFSTNGVMLRRAGETSTLTPGMPERLLSGDILEIGSRRARIEVIV